MKDILRFGVILFIITAVAAASLGYVNQITKGPIEEQTIIANNEARRKILPLAESFNQLEINVPEKYPIITEAYEGIMNDNLVGYTLKTMPKGYGGIMEVTVGMDIEGNITGVVVGNHNETPGLGAKSKDPEFTNHYRGKRADMDILVIKSGNPKENEVSAISGATVSSRAVTSGVNEAIRYFNENFK
ncbi:MAG: RnfABCDGE type electron transport complex subunit G [Peptostreptococcales bacterium]